MDDPVENHSPDEKSPPHEILLKKSKRQRTPAMVITIQSWATPIVGLAMLLVGLLGGYLLHPVVAARQVSSTTPPPSTAQAQQAQPTVDPTQSAKLMDFLVPQVKHFQGDANAPVTIIEFSDFQ